LQTTAFLLPPTCPGFVQAGDPALGVDNDSNVINGANRAFGAYNDSSVNADAQHGHDRHHAEHEQLDVTVHKTPHLSPASAAASPVPKGTFFMNS
jgi:hypothetical protein